MKNLDSWLKENFSSVKTRKLYRSAISCFHRSQGYPRTPEELEKSLKSWLVELNQKYKPKTVNAYVSAVMSFYSDIGIRLNEIVRRNLRRRLIPPPHPVTFDEAGSHDEWKRILSHMDIEGRSLFLFLLSTGCRIGEALQLKESDLDLDSDPPRAYIQPQYTKGMYGGRVVFMTYEARDAIKEWLKEKDNPVSPRRKRIPKRIYNPIKGGYTLNDARNCNPELVWDMKVPTARGILIRALRKSMLDEKDRNTGRYKIHIHSTRKFFRSNCGLNDALVHSLMGHSGYLDQSYLRTDIEKAGEEYRSIAIPRLTIFERPLADKIEMLKTFAKSLGIENIDIKIARMLEVHPELDEEEIIGRLIKQEITGQTSKKRRRLITENELPRYLEDGWEIEHVVNSKIVVAR